MSEENKYRKYRLSRGSDGSITGAKKVNEEDLEESWKKQSDSLQKDPSLKEEFGISRTTAKLKRNISKKKPKNIKVNKQVGGGNNVNIHLAVPKFNLPKGSILNKVGKKPLAISVLAVVIVGGGLIALSVGGKEPSQNSGEVQGETQEAIELNVKPEYAVISPDGAGAEFAKISPAGVDPIYAYTDEINGVPIKVTQQPIPDILKEDRINKTRELAEQFNARDEIFIDDYSAFVGTSEKGPQSVVFVRGDLMVLVASDSEIPNKSWVEYLGDLKY